MVIKEKWGIHLLDAELIKTIPNTTGVYLLMGEDKTITFVDVTDDLQQSLSQHLTENALPNVRYFMCYEMIGEPEARRFEAKLIAEYLPYYNIYPLAPTA